MGSESLSSMSRCRKQCVRSRVVLISVSWMHLQYNEAKVCKLRHDFNGMQHGPVAAASGSQCIQFNRGIAPIGRYGADQSSMSKVTATAAAAAAGTGSMLLYSCLQQQQQQQRRQRQRRQRQRQQQHDLQFCQFWPAQACRQGASQASIP